MGNILTLTPESEPPIFGTDNWALFIEWPSYFEILLGITGFPMRGILEMCMISLGGSLRSKLMSPKCPDIGYKMVPKPPK